MVADPVTAELRKAKKDILVIVEKSRESLLQEFAAEERRLMANAKLKVEDKIKQVEQVQEEKRAFETGGQLPRTPGLRVAVSDYQTKVATARMRCEKAFDAAAEMYVRTDVTAAKAVLAVKVDLLRNPGLGTKSIAAHAEDLPTSTAWLHNGHWHYRFARPNRAYLDEHRRTGTHRVEEKTGNVYFTWNNNDPGTRGEHLIYDQDKKVFSQNRFQKGQAGVFGL